jgi:glyoxylase-like metal-dependent hydrolase (beta-lactamase superfamily II)
VAETLAWLVEYGHVRDHPANLLIADRPQAELRAMPFCFAAIVYGSAVVLVDVGFSSEFHQRRLGGKYRDAVWCPPVDALARLGLDPADVDVIVLTHKHFDHVGALPDFPAARVLLRREEYERHRAAVGDPDRFTPAMFRATDPDLLDVLDTRAAAGLLTLVTGGEPTEPVPGVWLYPALDTHTPGSQYAVLQTATGPLIFPGDNVSAYENIEGVREPIGSLTGPVPRWHALADELVGVACGDTRRIVPFHDDEVWRRFPSFTFADGLHTAALTPATPLPEELAGESARVWKGTP